MTVKDITETNSLRGVMFMNSKSHEDYCETVNELLRTPPACGFFSVVFLLLARLFMKLNLDGVVQFLMDRDKYSIFGRRAHDPANMIRGCITAIILGKSFGMLAHDTLRDEKYAILCGFDPENPPGEATFYDFMERLWDGDTKNVSGSQIQKLTPKPERPPKGEKAPPVDKKTCAELLEEEKNATYNREKEPFFTWMSIFDIAALNVSLQNGTIDPTDLDLACDGTPVKTSERPRMHKYCPINAKENYRRKCKGMSEEEKRELSCYNPETGKYLCETEDYAGLYRVSQPDTNSGYDSSRDCYFSGYHAFFYTEVKSNLPIFQALNPGSTHDSHALIKSLGKLRAYYPNLVIKKLIADSAFDFKEIYDYLHEIDIEPFIDLNLRRATGTRSGGIVVTEDGPVCKENIQMCLSRIDRKAGIAVYACPKMVKENGAWRCTCTSPCSTAKNGRTTTVSLSALKDEIVNTPDKQRKGRQSEFQLPDGFYADESGAICCAKGKMKLLSVNEQRGKAVYKCPMMEKDENGNLQCKCSTPCSKAKTGRTLQTPIGYPNKAGSADSDSTKTHELDADPAHNAPASGVNPPLSDAELNQDAIPPEDFSDDAAHGDSAVEPNRNSSYDAATGSLQDATLPEASSDDAAPDVNPSDSAVEPNRDSSDDDAAGVNPPVSDTEANQDATLPENTSPGSKLTTKADAENGCATNPNISNKKPKKWEARFNKEGKPICSLGIPLKSNGTNRERETAMFLCPRMSTDENGNVVNTCPHPCEAAEGRHISIPLAENRRFLNATPRDSKKWKKIYNDRIASERDNKRIKCDLHLEAGRHRSGSKWHGRLYLIMIILHAMAWPDPATVEFR